MDVSEPIELIVYTAHGCCLCDDARRELDALAPSLEIDVRWVHIDGDAELEHAWRTQIPAGVMDGRKVFKYHVDAAMLERRVTEIRTRAQRGAPSSR